MRRAVQGWENFGITRALENQIKFASGQFCRYVKSLYAVDDKAGRLLVNVISI